LWREQNRLPESRELLERARTEFDAFINSREFRPFYSRFASELYASLADTLLALGEIDEATALHEDARRIARPARRGFSSRRHEERDDDEAGTSKAEPL
jgi:hypothetical protein